MHIFDIRPTDEDNIETRIYRLKNNYIYWEGTKYKDYHVLSPYNKGQLFEENVESFFLDREFEVLPYYDENGKKKDKGPWDRCITNWNTEIKGSLKGHDEDDFGIVVKGYVINHIKAELRWDRFIFYGKKSRDELDFEIVWCTREDMEKCLKETNWWKHQSGKNEFMCSGGNVIKWINSSYTRDIKTWNDEPAPPRALEGFMNGNVHTT